MAEVELEPQSGPTSVSLDDMERQTSAPVAPKLDEIKLDGEGVPEEFKGKSVTELMKLASGFGNALKVSERARENAETMARMASQAAPVAPPPPVEQPKEMSREDLAELYEKDPLRAIEIMNTQAITRAAAQYDQRIAALTAGTAGAVEQQTKQKYPEVFSTLGDEIEAVIKEVGGRERLTTQRAWDDLIAYVRGQPKNFDKLVEARMAATKATTVESARATQELEMGFQTTPRRGPGPSHDAGKMDPIKHQIASELNMTDEEYLRWEKVS